MKLYTEEQVRYLIGHLDPLLRGDDWCELFHSLTPIELPSDEEIKYTSELNLVEPYASYWRTGAKWVIEQIKQQGK